MGVGIGCSDFFFFSEKNEMKDFKVNTQFHCSSQCLSVWCITALSFTSSVSLGAVQHFHASGKGYMGEGLQCLRQGHCVPSHLAELRIRVV